MSKTLGHDQQQEVASLRDDVAAIRDLVKALEQASAREAIEEAMEGIALDRSKMHSFDDLYDAWCLLASVNEFFVDNITSAVIATADNAGTDPDDRDNVGFTFEQAGLLLKWADEVRELAADVVTNAKTVAVCVYAGSYGTSEGLTYPDGSPFRPGNEEYVAGMMRRLGADDV